MSEIVTPERQQGLRQAANTSRDVADEIAGRYECDDPHHPWGPQVFRDYEDFIERVARPLVEASESEDKQAVVQEAMALYRKENPYGICVSMVMLQSRARRAEAQVEKVKALTAHWTQEPARSQTTTYASIGGYLDGALSD